jgi:hypothetical protein
MLAPVPPAGNLNQKFFQLEIPIPVQKQHALAASVTLKLAGVMQLMQVPMIDDCRCFVHG